MIYYMTKDDNGKPVLHDASDLSQFDGFYTTADITTASTNVRIWNEEYKEYDLESAYSLRGGSLKPKHIEDINYLSIKKVFDEIVKRDEFGLVEFYFNVNGIGYSSIIQNTNLGYSIRTSVNGQKVPSFIINHNAPVQSIIDNCK